MRAPPMREVVRNNPDLFRQTAFDRVVSYFAPESGLRRMEARARLSLLGAGGYKSGNRSRRALSSWGLSTGSADAEILPDLERIRSDSRDLLRNAPLARGAINTVCTNVVGTGLKPQARPDRDVLKEKAGLTDEQIDRFEREAERIFRGWAKKKNGDAARQVTFPAMQNLAFRAALESGDVFAVRRYIKRPGQQIGLALQILEADRVFNPNMKQDSASLSGGVERDKFGAPVAYHVSKTHPGNHYLSRARFETVRVPAYMSNGDWNVLHLMTQERPEQTRGVPYLAPVIEPLKQLDRYSEAEIMSAVISSMFTVFVKTEDGAGIDALNEDTRSAQQSDELKLGNGAVLDLLPGEDVEFANPARPNPAFDPFVMAVMRQIGVALEIPFELLVKHFTSSYSAARAALLEAWKFFRARRSWLVENFCDPVWEAVISEAVASGILAAPGFFSSPEIREAYLLTEWVGPPRGMIDEKKEVEAAAIMEDRGYKTGQEITAELTGGDWDRKHERLKKERRMKAESGSAGPALPPEEDDPKSENDGDVLNDDNED